MRARRVRIGVTPPHDVVLGRGLLPRLGELVGDVLPSGPLVLATDAGLAATPHVAAARAALEAAGRRVVVEVLPQGERAKTIRGAEQVWDALARARVGRDGGVVALGGGAVGDVAGFAAATWMRGIAVVQVPTTVLAMADSSVGGKTAIDRDDGKNLVGAFHQPRIVVDDVDTLATLPPREVRAGLAEVVKCAVLDGPDAMDRIAAAAGLLAGGDPDALLDAILLAVAVKARHVKDDQHETGGSRILLNLGHTVAHALEALDGYVDLRHGEAVAYGLVVAARIAALRGLADTALVDRVLAVLRALGLPCAAPAGVAAPDVIAATRLDKKRRGGRLVMVLPLGAGGAVAAEVDDDDLIPALAM